MRAPRSLFPLLLLIGFALLFFGRFLLSPTTMPFGQDTLDIGVTNKLLAVKSITSERLWPLWNPYPHCGMPFMASLPMGLFYPPSLAFLFVPVPLGISLLFLFHNVLAGAGMYLLSGRMMKDKGARLFSSLLYAYSGDLITHIHAGHDGKIFVMSWAPWAMAFLLGALRGDRRQWPLLAGVVGLCFLTPHVQLTYYLCMALGIGVAYHGLVLDPKPRRFAIHLGCLSACLILAVGIASPQLVPAWQLSRQATRGELDYAAATFFSMPLEELLDTLVPSFTGFEPCYWGHRFFKHYIHYLGVLPLFLAALALCRLNRHKLFWLLLGLFALMMGLGGSTPAYRLAYLFLPMIKKMRSPESILYLATLSASVLAGMGLEMFLSRDPARLRGLIRKCHVIAGIGALPGLFLLSPKRVAMLCLVIFHPGPPESRIEALSQNLPEACLGSQTFLILLLISWGLCILRLRGRLTPRLWLTLAIGLTLGDLWRVELRFLWPISLDKAYAQDDIIERIIAAPKPFRAVQEDPSTFGYPYRFSRLAYHGIETCGGYQNLSLRWVDEVAGLMTRENVNMAHILDIMNVRFILSGVHKAAGQLADAIKVAENEQAGLFERPRVLPRYHFVDKVVWVADEKAMLGAVANPEFDPWREAVVLGNERGEERFERADQAPHMRAEKTQTLRIALDNPSEGFLIASEAFTPLCRAFIDSKPVPVFRANHAFRGVRVPAGSRELLMDYSDETLKITLPLSVLSMALVFGVLTKTARTGKLGGPVGPVGPV